eukprot:SAG11_NODE_35628_length_265_cov_2.180723_1_plen_64_part_01
MICREIGLVHHRNVQVHVPGTGTKQMRLACHQKVCTAATPKSSKVVTPILGKLVIPRIDATRY